MPGAVRLLMSVDSLDRPVMVLGVIGADFVVERPAELSTGIVEAVAVLRRSMAIKN